MQDFHRLQVWQKAHELAVDIFRISQHFPHQSGVALTNQLRRAALSIPSNIAEGAGKPSSSDFHRFLQIAMGSASETQYQLLLARDIGLLHTERYDDLSMRTVEIRRMLVGLAKRVASRHPGVNKADRTAPRLAPSNDDEPAATTIPDDDSPPLAITR